MIFQIFGKLIQTNLPTLLTKTGKKKKEKRKRGKRNGKEKFR